MKHEYHEGPETLKRFEDGMKKLFQAPKPKSRVPKVSLLRPGVFVLPVLFGGSVGLQPHE